MLHVLPKHKAELLEILSPYKEYEMYAYGSRVKGTHRKNSDLDLCFMKDMPWKTLDDLRDKFSESNLPFFVTIAPWKEFDATFKTLIQKDLLPIDQW